jgi:heme/copper-type cytochrome/quinol oxidase subunit 1
MNVVSSIGAYIGGIALLVFLYVLFRTLLMGERAAANYWGEGATTLEWTVSSPCQCIRSWNCREMMSVSRRRWY